jgi:hypothetical protein
MILVALLVIAHRFKAFTRTTELLLNLIEACEGRYEDEVQSHFPGAKPAESFLE